jgi:hypothetical protein
MAIGHLAKAPDELFSAGGWTYRVAQGNPAPAGDLVHHERVARLIEQQALVAGERGVTHGQV